MSDSLQHLLRTMVLLRDPENGCEWDRQQSFATIAPYTIEEAYEVADAINRGDMLALRDELGDLLLQVVFHARIAEEAGLFSFEDVAGAITAKLEARHPHIFAAHVPADTEDQSSRWERLKAEERANSGQTGALDGIALALPALLRAEKLQKRAARVGFDWPDTAGPEAKVVEEMRELADSTPESRIGEAGDLLFAAVNLVRAHGISAETALRQANAKFERRFKAMEFLAGKRSQNFSRLSLDEQEALWCEVKQSEAVESS